MKTVDNKAVNVIALIQKFSTVPVDSEDNTTEAFEHFEAGTDRIEILAWLDSLHEDVYVNQYMK